MNFKWAFGLGLLAAGLGFRAPAAPSPAGPAGEKKWKMVFDDEFEGKAIDTTKWTKRVTGGGFCYHGAKSEVSDDHAFLDGQGNFVLKVTKDENGVYHYHNGMFTKGKFDMTYGYVETRARFSRQPGWWGAVWMYGLQVGPNPFAMGQEIDIFEDFYKPKKINDFQHCLHFDAQLARALESDKKFGDLEQDTITRISRGHKLTVEDWDAFHTVGVEWSPLEYVFYVDGKETFRQTFREVPVTNQPMHILISGCYRDPLLSPYAGNYADGTWPDELKIDYVRAWQADPGGRAPEVRLKMLDPVDYLEADEDATFEMDAQSAIRNPQSAIKNVYLFTNGRLRGELTTGTASGRLTLPAARLHVGENILIAMARDEAGRVGQSEPLMLVVRAPREGGGTPYQGKAQAVPGRVLAGRYDEGGQRVAYLWSPKTVKAGTDPEKNKKFRGGEMIEAPNEEGISVQYRGQWVSYTIDVATTGTYRVAPLIARPDATAEANPLATDLIRLEVDGARLVDMPFSSRMGTGKQYYGDWQAVGSRIISLNAGRHVLLVRFQCHGLQFGGVNFEAVKY